MASKIKTFDCVEMKNHIQAELLSEKARIGEEEFSRREKAWIETTDDPLAVWWRAVTSRGTVLYSAGNQEHKRA